MVRNRDGESNFLKQGPFGSTPPPSIGGHKPKGSGRNQFMEDAKTFHNSLNLPPEALKPPRHSGRNEFMDLARH